MAHFLIGLTLGVIITLMVINPLMSDNTQTTSSIKHTYKIHKAI